MYTPGRENRVANALSRKQQVVVSLMMSEWNDLFTKFIGRFDVHRFIELYLISFLDLRLMFFYGVRFIGCTVIILH